jgi:hypothetical protein
MRIGALSAFVRGDRNTFHNCIIFKFSNSIWLSCRARRFSNASTAASRGRWLQPFPTTNGSTIMLQAPPTIRLPRPEELPNNPEVFERLKQRANANIVEGYTLKYNSTHDLPFKFYAEVNIDNTRLWKLFLALVAYLPDQLSCIYNVFGEDTIYSDSTYKGHIMTQLDNYKIELTQDCNLEFDLIYHAEDKLEEVFIADSKFLKIWGCNEILFRQIMSTNNLREIPDLNFIDEFPKVVEPLTNFNDKARPTQTVIDDLNNFFAIPKITNN